MHAVVAPTLVQAAHGDGKPGRTQRWGSGCRAVTDTLGTVTASGGHAIGAAMLVQTGYGERTGQVPRSLNIEAPLGTIVGGGVKHAVVSAFLEQANGAGGEHHAVVECTLSPDHKEGALRVAAFLINYYGNGQALDLAEPLDTVTTRDRIALVTVIIKGTPYVIVDIGLRMLRREELFRAQGFPADYIIDRTADCTPLSISASVRMVGNSVSPPALAAIARANLDPVTEKVAVAA
jgi:DNA (cytosine-5)-methyltransferase 1